MAASDWFANSTALDDICWQWVRRMYLLNATVLDEGKRKNRPDVKRLMRLMGEVLGPLESGKIKRAKTIVPATIIRNTTLIIDQAKSMESVTTLLTADRDQVDARATGKETGLTEFTASDGSVWKLSHHPFATNFSPPYNHLFNYASFGFVAVSPEYDYSLLFVDGGVSAAHKVNPPEQFVEEFLKVMKEEKVLPQATDDALRAVAQRTGDNPQLMMMFFELWKEQASSASVPPSSVEPVYVRRATALFKTRLQRTLAAEIRAQTLRSSYRTDTIMNLLRHDTARCYIDEDIVSNGLAYLASDDTYHIHPGARLAMYEMFRETCLGTLVFESAMESASSLRRGEALEIAFSVFGPMNKGYTFRGQLLHDLSKFIFKVDCNKAVTLTKNDVKAEGWKLDPNVVYCMPWGLVGAPFDVAFVIASKIDDVPTVCYIQTSFQTYAQKGEETKAATSAKCSTPYEAVVTMPTKEMVTSAAARGFGVDDVRFRYIFVSPRPVEMPVPSSGEFVYHCVGDNIADCVGTVFLEVAKKALAADKLGNA